MGKLKKSRNRNTFNYNSNKKKIKQKERRKYKPQIDCPQIRKAWDDNKTAKQNLQDMGLLYGSKGILPIKTNTKNTEEESEKTNVLLKPNVIEEMEAEASQRGGRNRSCSTDIIEYVQHMLREHNEDYKAMARDEKNYYQDTPKQIKRKVELYRRCYPEKYATFIASLPAQKSS